MSLFRWFLAASVAVAGARAQMVLDLRTAILTLDSRCLVTSLQSATGGEYGAPGGAAAFALVYGNRVVSPTACRWAAGVLTVEFTGARATFAVDAQPGFAVFELQSLSTAGDPDRFTLFRMRLRAPPSVAGTMNGLLYDDFTVAAIAAEVNVQAHMAGAELLVDSYRVHGLRPARFGIVAAAAGRFDDTVGRFQVAAGLPSPKPGGEWGKHSPLTRRSYFFLTRFKESDFDAALAIARRGGFDTILIDQSSWCRSTGHYGVNLQNFPGGLAALARTIRRFKDAGFRVGLHFLAASIYPPDEYLAPRPDPRLVKNQFATLSADIDEKAAVLPVAGPPAGFPSEDGGYTGTGAVIQIDDELIFYAARSTDAPYAFRDCRRGYLGTHAAPHARGARVEHLLKSYGYFLFDMDTSLLGEAASQFAAVANACEIDMIYFDGAERLQGDHWYYNAKLIKAFYDRLRNKDMLLQASSMSPYSWHMLSRSASADGHDDLKGYLDERSPNFDTLARNRMPLDIGWYYGYDVEATPDQFEYILGATIGYDSSMSFQVSPAAVSLQPFSGVILDMISAYEKLRLSGRVPREMRERLRIDPALGGRKTDGERARLLDQRREYRFSGNAFQRVIYGPWQTLEKTGEIAIHVPEPGARVGVQLHVKPSPWFQPGPSYTDGRAVLLEDFRDLAIYTARNTSAGVTQSYAPCSESGHQSCAALSATSAAAGGWSVVGRRYPQSLDLSAAGGIGFWLRGDAAGASFKLQLLDESGHALDYYIANGYTGWRYQQLARPAAGAIDWSRIRSLYFYYNNLPAHTTVACGIDGVKAIPAVDPQRVVEPRVEIGGHEIRWRGSMAAGQWMVAWPGEPVQRYGPGVSGTSAVETAPEVALPAGDQNVRVLFDGVAPLQVRLTLQTAERYKIP